MHLTALQTLRLQFKIYYNTAEAREPLIQLPLNAVLSDHKNITHRHDKLQC